MCKHLNHFARQYDSAANNGKGRRANEVEVELQTNTHRVFLEEEFFKRCISVLFEGRKIAESKIFPVETNRISINLYTRTNKLTSKWLSERTMGNLRKLSLQNISV